MGKNLLIIGNGFDLANGLPTKYGQFLDFAQCFMAIFSDEFKYKEYPYFYKKVIYDEINARHWDESQYLNKNVEKKIEHIYEIQHNLDRNDEYNADELYIIDRLRKLLIYNIMYDYFCAIRYKISGDNWIDFESEIAFIIKWLDSTGIKLTDWYTKVDFVNLNQGLGAETLRQSELDKIREFGSIVHKYDGRWSSESHNFLLVEFIEKLYSERLQRHDCGT